jgi:hypothetical protein
VIDGQGKDVNDITLRPDMVEVTVPIVPVSRINIRPDIKGNPPEGYIIRDVTVDTPALLVTADKEVLANLQAIDTDPIYIQGNTKTLQVETNLRLPQGVKLFEEDIQTVKVTIVIEKLTNTSFTISSEAIEVENKDPDTAVILESREIIVEASGPESLMDRVREDMVQMFIDVSGFEEGEHQIKITANISRPYMITNVEPAEIGVTVRYLDSSRRGDNI